ncbi:hypothetical protein VCR1J2_200594 [Vibrio coralliirubri]|nr:hypothetical protein VCR1J2_200594 [Vibrio coralliirubri]
MLSNLLKSQVSVLWIHFLQVYSQLFELYKKIYSLCCGDEVFIEVMGIRVCVIACEVPKLAGTIGFTMPVVCTLLIIFPEA